MSSKLPVRPIAFIADANGMQLNPRACAPICSIEQDSDTVTLIYHPSESKLVITSETNYPVTPDILLLMVEKNRNGARSTIYFSQNPSMTQNG